MMVEICVCIYIYMCVCVYKLHTYLYHNIVVLDKYLHSNLVYYKHSGDDEPYEIRKYSISSTFKFCMWLYDVVNMHASVILNTCLFWR